MREQRSTTHEIENQVQFSQPSPATSWFAPSFFSSDVSGNFQNLQYDGMDTRSGLAQEGMTPTMSPMRPAVPQINVIQATPMLHAHSQSLSYQHPPRNAAESEKDSSGHVLFLYDGDGVDPDLSTPYPTPRSTPYQTPTLELAVLTTPISPSRTVSEPPDEYLALISGIQGIRDPREDDLFLAQYGMHMVDSNQQYATPYVPTPETPGFEVSHDQDVEYVHISYEGQDVLHDESPTRPPTALDLIGAHRANGGSTHARPYGLQRMTTLAFVEQQATKFNVPVPSITEEAVNAYCHSQYSPFDAVHSTFPPESINVRVLGGMDLSAEEILTFFPHHLKWHDAIFRLVQNGWSPHDMAKYINYTRGLVSPNDKRGNTVLKWLQSANGAILGKPKQAFSDRGRWPVVGFSAGNWVPYAHRNITSLIDYFLVDLAMDVVHLPGGDGARLLTRAMVFAMKHGHYDVKLSQVRQYIRENLLFFPPLPSMIKGYYAGRHPDRLAVDRARVVVENAKRQRKQLAAAMLE
jgi:hypothetical protein